MIEQLEPLSFVLSVWASVIIARSGIRARLQLAAYFVVAWLVPIFGAVIASAVVILRSRPATSFSERASNAQIEAVQSVSRPASEER